MQTVPFVILPQVDYEKTRHLQVQLLNLIYQNNLPGIFLLLEHNPVLTLGRSANQEHILTKGDFLEKRGIHVYPVERGGDVTYHGPGQIVGYPLVNLSFWHKDVHLFLRKIEETLIRFLKRYQLDAFRLPPHTGVWTNVKKPVKIAAIGLAVKKWITYHGFALNISTDLTPFSYIIPCGISDKGVTSLSFILGEKFSDSERKCMMRELADDFSWVFGWGLNEENSNPFEQWYLNGDIAPLLSILRKYKSK